MIRDISNWEIDETIMASGTRAKYWLIDNTQPGQIKKRYLFKLPKENTGEIWAEKIAAEVGKVLGLETMTVEIAEHNDNYGLLLTNFTDENSEFFDGGDLIKRNITDFDTYDLKDYNLETVMNSLKPFNLESDMISIIIFDALIANQDRHCENWGIIQHNEDFKMTPVFDNGASLGYNNSEERIKLMFQDIRMFEAFTNKSKSIIGLIDKKKPKLTTFLPELLELYPDCVRKELNRLERLKPEALSNILNRIPGCIMSEIHKEWVTRLLFYRKSWLINLLKEH